MSDNQLLEVIERYLSGEMTDDERKKFELLRKENMAMNNRVQEHEQFATILKQYAERVELENRLNAIHDEIDVDTLKESLMVHPSWIVQMWRHHHSKISVAASVLLFVIMSIMYFTGSFKNSDSQYVALNSKIAQQSKDIKALSNDIQKAKHIDKFTGSGSGFAFTTDGLIATCYHVVRGADSVYVQNADGAYKAEVLYTDPQKDIAILKITDDQFKGLGPIPYSFKKGESDLAETISTFGYPDGKPVYHNGVINASTGLNGDSVHYQISIPINFGNSGGPLFDSKGNLIGITDAKQGHAEGDHYAIKARYLIDAIHNIPTDSLNQTPILNRKNTLSGLSEDQKLKREKNFVFMVKTFNN